MALKHLKNAIELLNAGMSINDIKTIIAMKDEPEQTEETTPAGPGQEEGTQDEPGQEEGTQDEPVTEPGQEEVETKPKKNPYQEKSENRSSQENLVDELNKLF